MLTKEPSFASLLIKQSPAMHYGHGWIMGKERVSLIDKVAGSVANPANRRRELMARMRGFEDLANEAGLAGRSSRLPLHPNITQCSTTGAGTTNTAARHRVKRRNIFAKYGRARVRPGCAMVFACLAFALLSLTTTKPRTGTSCFSCARSISNRQQQSFASTPCVRMGMSLAPLKTVSK